MKIGNRSRDEQSKAKTFRSKKVESLNGGGIFGIDAGRIRFDRDQIGAQSKPEAAAGKTDDPSGVSSQDSVKSATHRESRRWR